MKKETKQVCRGQSQEAVTTCHDCCCENENEQEEREPTLFEEISHQEGQQEKYRYQVEGMDCGACAQTIQKGVAALPGVTQVAVNFAAGKMLVVTQSSKIAKEEIIDKVAQLGYSATLEGETTVSSTQKSKRRLILATSLFILGFVMKWFIASHWLANLFFALTIVTAGAKTFKSAWNSLKAKSLDMNVLMASAAVGAVLLGEWSEGATVLYLFVIGVFLQNKAVTQTRKSIQQMMSLAPDQTLVRQGDRWKEEEVARVKVGATILVRAGDKIALDGVVAKGLTEVNQAAITGESIPVTKQVGDSVYAGSLNESGTIEVTVTKTASNSTIAKIIEMVEEADERKAPSEAFIDRFARIYTPIVFVIALLMMIVPPMMGADLHESVFKGIELLIVACPCALVISTPVSIVSAIGNAAQKGILIKGGVFLETAARTTMVAFDKTGTITEGKPKVVGIEVLQGTMMENLTIAYSLEKNATHPLAKAIVQYAEKQQVVPLEVYEEKNWIGKGVQGVIQGEAWQIGSSKLFDLSMEWVKRKEQCEEEGKTAVFVGKNRTAWSMILIQDSIRSSSVQAIERLRSLGIERLMMLTGDNQAVAEDIAKKAGLSGAVAEMLPQDKAKTIEKMQQQEVVAMVGDGINDAPALAVSDLGIAMGGVGTDTAMETADIVLLADCLDQLPFVFELGKATVRIIKQNIFGSLLIKIIALGFIFAGLLPIWLAVLSDTGMAVLVTLNALRLAVKKN